MIWSSDSDSSTCSEVGSSGASLLGAIPNSPSSDSPPHGTAPHNESMRRQCPSPSQTSSDGRRTKNKWCTVKLPEKGKMTAKAQVPAQATVSELRRVPPFPPTAVLPNQERKSAPKALPKLTQEIGSSSHSKPFPMNCRPEKLAWAVSSARTPRNKASIMPVNDEDPEKDRTPSEVSTPVSCTVNMRESGPMGFSRQGLSKTDTATAASKFSPGVQQRIQQESGDRIVIARSAASRPGPNTPSSYSNKRNVPEVNISHGCDHSDLLRKLGCDHCDGAPEESSRRKSPAFEQYSNGSRSSEEPHGGTSVSEDLRAGAASTLPKSEYKACSDEEIRPCGCRHCDTVFVTRSRAAYCPGCGQSSGIESFPIASCAEFNSVLTADLVPTENEALAYQSMTSPRTRRLSLHESKPLKNVTDNHQTFENKDAEEMVHRLETPRPVEKGTATTVPPAAVWTKKQDKMLIELTGRELSMYYIAELLEKDLSACEKRFAQIKPDDWRLKSTGPKGSTHKAAVETPKFSISASEKKHDNISPRITGFECGDINLDSHIRARDAHFAPLNAGRTLNDEDEPSHDVYSSFGFIKNDSPCAPAWTLPTRANESFAWLGSPCNEEGDIWGVDTTNNHNVKPSSANCGWGPVEWNANNQEPSQEPQHPRFKPCTITYKATIRSGDRLIEVPIDSVHVSGPEKSIATGGMQKVWKWINDMQLSDKVGLQDAFDLAKSMYGEDLEDCEAVKVGKSAIPISSRGWCNDADFWYPWGS